MNLMRFLLDIERQDGVGPGSGGVLTRTQFDSSRFKGRYRAHGQVLIYRFQSPGTSEAECSSTEGSLEQ